MRKNTLINKFKDQNKKVGRYGPQNIKHFLMFNIGVLINFNQRFKHNIFINRN